MRLLKRIYHEFEEDEVSHPFRGPGFLLRVGSGSHDLFPHLHPGVLAQGHDLQSGLLGYAARFMPPDAYTLLQKTLQEITTSSTGLKLALGMVLALWAGDLAVSVPSGWTP